MANRSNIKAIGNPTTGQNVGDGAGIFKLKNNNNLQFKSLAVSGSSIAIYNCADTIYISGATGGGTIISGTNGYLPKFNATGDNIINSNLYMGQVCVNGIGCYPALLSDCLNIINFGFCNDVNKGITLNYASGSYAGPQIQPSSASNTLRLKGGSMNLGVCNCIMINTSNSANQEGRISGLQYGISGGIACDCARITYLGGEGESNSSGVYKGNGAGLIGGDGVRFNGNGGDVLIRAGLGNGTGLTGNVIIERLPAKTSQTNVIYIGSNGKLYSGATSGGSSTISGTPNYLSKFNGTGDNVCNSSIIDNGTCITTTSNCITIGTAGSAPIIKSPDSSTTTSDLIIKVGCNTSSGCGGSLYLSAGQSVPYTSSGIFLGHPTFSQPTIWVRPAGTLNDMTLAFGSKGNGLLYLNSTAGVIIGNGISNCAIHVVGTTITTSYTSNMCIVPAATSATTGCTLTIAGGYATNTGCGGDLVLCAGSGSGGCSSGKIKIINLPAKTTETCIIYIDANGKLSKGTAPSSTGGTGGGIGWSNITNGSTVAGCGTCPSTTNLCQNTLIGVNAGKTMDATSRGNVALGYNSLQANTSGCFNIGVGFQPLFSNSTGYENVALGLNALYQNTTGYYNIAQGSYALTNNTIGHNNIANGYMTLSSSTGGTNNIAQGNSALQANRNGSHNIAQGCETLYFNTSGANNIAQGQRALRANTTGNYNIAQGFYSLYTNTTGNNNIAQGYYALRQNTTGCVNIAQGVCASYNNTSGSRNIAVGCEALWYNRTGCDNIAMGYDALYWTDGSNNIALGYGAQGGAGVNDIGNCNIAIGRSSMSLIDTGNSNIAIGVLALECNKAGCFNVAIGEDAGLCVCGSYNVAVGFEALFCNIGERNVAIGAYAGMHETGSDKLYIANTDTCALICGDFAAKTLCLDAAVTVVTLTCSSDIRKKTNIQPLCIEPVNVEYKQFEHISEPNQIRYGVIAQDIQARYPELVRTESDGMLSVHYTDLMVKEIAYLKNKVADLEQKINYLLEK